MFQTTSALAGLGLFLTGLRLLATSLQPLAGRRVRTLLSKVTSGPVSTAFAGSFLGGLTQSTSASAFVCLGLVNSGTLTFNRAFTLVAWSSVGTSLLVFLAAIDLRLAGLYMVGIVGLGHLFHAGRFGKGQHTLSFMFALGVLFLGLGMIKDGSIGLRESLWLKDYLGMISEWGIIGFVLGIVVTLIAQSSATVTILVVTLNLSGLLSFQDALVLVFGSSIGSGVSVALVTSHLKGRQRQLGIFQLLVKFAGVFFLLPIFFINWNQLHALMTDAGILFSTATQLAMVYLALQVTGAIIATSAQTFLHRLLDRICPVNSEEDLYAPHYIYPEAAADPDTALILAKKEQDRLLALLPDYLDAIRSEAGVTSRGMSTEERHAATCRLIGHVKNFIEEVAATSQIDSSINDIFALQRRNELISSIQDSLHSFVTTLESIDDLGATTPVSLIESLHLILTLIKDDMADEADNSDLLEQLTSDKSAIMENLRNSLLTSVDGALNQRQSLFVSTSIFERIVWLVRQLAQLNATPLAQN